MNTANEWVRTDAAACRADVARLGLSEAADYQMSLIVERQAAGDTRWDGVTEEDMVEALEALGVQPPKAAPQRPVGAPRGEGRRIALTPKQVRQAE